MTKRSPNPYFEFQRFTIYHDKCAMKVGTDGVLLGAWAAVDNATKALDIGTGTGLIALMLAQRNKMLLVDAIDIESNAIVQAKDNVQNSPFGDRVNIIGAALQEYEPKREYDVIVSNPPFFTETVKSPNHRRSMARNSESLPADDLLAGASRLLSNDGKLSVIYPFDYKDRLSILASAYHLNVTRMLAVYPTPQSDPKRIMMEFSKKKETFVEDKELIIEIDRHVYSDCFLELVNEFYLKE